MSIPLTARAPVEFTPPSLAEQFARQNAERLRTGEASADIPKIIVRVPTMYERDSFAAALVRGGVVHYSKQQIRDLMLAGVQYLHPEDKFDEIRSQLEDLWQAGDSMQKASERQRDRYIELMEQQKVLPEAKRMSEADMEAELNAITPDIVIPDTQRVKITAIQQDITSRYEPLQKAFADLAEQDTRRSWLCIEIYVVGWKGLEHEPDGNGRGGITRHEAEWLRGKIGGEAFDELGNFIFALTTLDGDEEKNLASLIESLSAPTGSQATQDTMSDPAIDAGSSTGEPSIATPDTGSRKTTDSSSASSTPAKKKTAPSKPSQTGGR